MGRQVLPALLLIASTLALIVGTILLPPGLYSTRNPQEQARIVEAHRGRFNVAQPINILAVALVAVGFGLLALRMSEIVSPWMPGLGALAFGLGSIAGGIFIYLQTVDPTNAYAGRYATWEAAAYWAWLAGLVLFGIGFLQVGLPSWLGYLTAGVAVAYSGFYLFTGAGFMVPFLEAPLALVVAIVLLTR